ncbi:MAG: bifunctional histidinol-phosphatase/imidazoleglycerol-phosphate dehydratase HisB [Bacteroidetes bacterium]|nr:bifunctional histidinol-phosphatase/imidazoleglycerol-phosphate dehydratase HisB [Bacteroidota bacterium]
MKKILFIDRDGTIIWEPPTDFQIDSFDKFRFLPGVISNLAKIARELDYELVMVTNQDGLGTESFPENTFWPVQNLMVSILESEGIKFSEICIDRTFEKDNAFTRKPNTGMLTKYLDGSYDLKNSFVIGDRITDVKLAKNLGAGAIFIKNYDDVNSHKNDISLQVDNWNEIYEFLKLPARKSSVIRETKETVISVDVNLDGNGSAVISTGLGFFDHMLEQIAKHANIDILIKAKGDLHIDEHHTIEDTGIALGEAFLKALDDKKGIERYGFGSLSGELILPMDDCLAKVAIDFGGRSWLVWEADFKREKIGEMPTEMFFHFFKSFSDASKSNINIKAEGQNEHHKIEAIFKAFAKSIKIAVKRDINNMKLPTTKGVL